MEYVKIWSMTNCKFHVSGCDMEKYCLVIFYALVMQ